MLSWGRSTEGGAVMTLDRRRFLQAGLAFASVSLATGCSRVAPAGWPRVRPRRVGFLNQASAPQDLPPDWAAWRDHLAALGWIEGENLVVEWRHADDSEERLREMAADLVRIGVDVIYAWTTPETAAALEATARIPIVGALAEPLKPGPVTIPAPPGDNFTGVSNRDIEAIVMRIELLKKCVPGLTRMALIKNGRGPITPGYFAAVDAIVRTTDSLGIVVENLVGDVDNNVQLEETISRLLARHPDALYVASSTMFFATRQAKTHIADLAIRHGLPAVANNVSFTQAGLLLAYGANDLDLRRRSAILVDRVLRGAKPAELPIERASRFDVGMNLKTAATLGVTIPQPVLDQATYLIR
jgi:putative tryptophan/tyrosine transport system substrate-binding protein